MADAAVQVPEAQEHVNSFGRIFGALFSPKATFASIAKKPTWLLPVVLMCLLFLAVVGIFGHRGGWPSYIQKQMASNARVQQMTPEQQQQALETSLKITRFVVLIEGFIIPPLLVVILAAVYLGIFNGLAGARVNFKTSMGIVAHAWVPNLISGILGVLIVAVKDPSTIDLQNIVASNAGALLSSGSAKWLISLLGSIDIFSFWSMILLAIGYTAAAPKQLTVGKAFAWIFVVWLAFVLVKVGLVAAFS